MTEELLKRIEELEEQNKKLKERLRKRNNHGIIKTKKKDIVKYWTLLQDECGLSVDWAEAHERCWRCGHKAPLQRCHIIPESLGGKDESANLVLLCSRCHIDAPNVESKTFMWDWIRANGTAIYDTFWSLRAQKEYEFVYGKSFVQELIDRDIVSDYDLRLFWNLKIGRSVHHFAHPWNNESTDAGLLKMRLDEFDKNHPIINKKSKVFREKEKEFEYFILKVCDIAKKYNFDVLEGRSQNLHSVTLSTWIDRNKKIRISIKLCKGNIYKACFTDEINPNRNQVKDYVIELGTEESAINFLNKELEKFTNKYGMKKEKSHIFTINPIFHLGDDEE